MKKTYSSPQMQVIEVSSADIIATSTMSLSNGDITITEGTNDWPTYNPGW